jgi:hypothetical protein
MLNYNSVTSIAVASSNITNEETSNERRGGLSQEYLSNPPYE